MLVDSGQAAIGEHIANVADRAEPAAMRLPVLSFLIVLLTGCSPEPDQQADAPRDATETAGIAAIKSARQACKHLRGSPEEHKKFDVGISDYEACLGERANLTRPANRQLCDLAKSAMSASGTCVLGE